MSTGSAIDPMGPVPAPVGRVRRVRGLYRLAGARWYDPFRRTWTSLASRRAEAALDRLVLKWAREGCDVLDIGCGTGHNLGRLQRLGVPFASYQGIDLTDAMLAIARRHYGGETRATFVQADLRALASAPKRFDVILCTWVALHLARPRDVFDLAYRLLAPAGHAFFLTVTRPRWYVSCWLKPLLHLFQARCVEPDMVLDLSGLVEVRTWSAGLVTLAHFAQTSGRAIENGAGRRAVKAATKIH